MTDLMILTKNAFKVAIRKENSTGTFRTRNARFFPVMFRNLRNFYI
jgi:hypothetical protein